jgi:hypothetical protein
VGWSAADPDAARREWIQNHRRRLRERELRVLDYSSVPNDPCFDSESGHDSISSLSSSASSLQHQATAPCLPETAARLSTDSTEGRTEALNASYPLLSLLLMLKAAFLIFVSSPVALRDAVAAYLLQSVGSRLVEVLLLQTIFWTSSILFSAEGELDNESLSSSRRPSQLSRPSSSSWSEQEEGGPWGNLISAGESRSQRSSEWELDSWPPHWDSRIIVRDPDQEHSLDILRAPQVRAQQSAGRGTQVHPGRSRVSPPEPRRVGYRHTERGPKEILDDLVTV